MGGKGGSSTARSANCANDKFIVNHIMLRYRPIAPKPADGDSVSVGSTPETNNVPVIPKDKRTKRKYVTVRKNKERASTATDCKNDEIAAKRSLVTLQLLPEKSDGKDLVDRGSSGDLDPTGIRKKTCDHQDPPLWLNFKNSINNCHVPEAYGGCGSDLDLKAAATPQRRLVESWVVVECVTETSMDGRGLGFSDMEKVKNLEVDTCPGFISDGLNRVQWVNEAYKEMVMEGEEYCSYYMHMVWLVMKEKYCLPYFYPAFACRVRVEYTWRDHKCSRTMPCDVWRMHFGGFAWKLDVKAALCLGR